MCPSERKVKSGQVFDSLQIRADGQLNRATTCNWLKKRLFREHRAQQKATLHPPTLYARVLYYTRVITKYYPIILTGWVYYPLVKLTRVHKRDAYIARGERETVGARIKVAKAVRAGIIVSQECAAQICILRMARMLARSLARTFVRRFAPWLAGLLARLRRVVPISLGIRKLRN